MLLKKLQLVQRLEIIQHSYFGIDKTHSARPANSLNLLFIESESESSSQPWMKQLPWWSELVQKLAKQKSGEWKKNWLL